MDLQVNQKKSDSIDYDSTFDDRSTMCFATVILFVILDSFFSGSEYLIHRNPKAIYMVVYPSNVILLIIVLYSEMVIQTFFLQPNLTEHIMYFSQSIVRLLGLMLREILSIHPRMVLHRGRSREMRLKEQPRFCCISLAIKK
jgi:hypothetical protein